MKMSTTEPHDMKDDNGMTFEEKQICHEGDWKQSAKARFQLGNLLRPDKRLIEWTMK